MVSRTSQRASASRRCMVAALVGVIVSAMLLSPAQAELVTAYKKNPSDMATTELTPCGQRWKGLDPNKVMLISHMQDDPKKCLTCFSVESPKGGEKKFLLGVGTKKDRAGIDIPESVADAFALGEKGYLNVLAVDFSHCSGICHDSKEACTLGVKVDKRPDKLGSEKDDFYMQNPKAAADQQLGLYGKDGRITENLEKGGPGLDMLRSQAG
ncbi:hypothetical protein CAUPRSCDRAFT_12612 [Caulochytrium protostelioides]|uniref:Uncharacterized protein n=1 Tax=Caulochytrium protostelioides TaxID=1555241 RepID=A0A4P9WUF1_9FUNG|nr:hypothetical protein CAUPRSCDRAFT_12612 [Caulochytrium protostelioides]